MKPQRTFSGMLMLGLLLLFTASLSLAREKGPDDAMLEGSSSQTTGPDVADPGTVRTSPRGIPLEARGTRDQGSPQTLNWQIETVDDAGDVGQYTSLSLTSKDEPYVSYYDVGNEALKVAYLDGSTWDIDVVHSDPFYGYGEYTSLALDSSDLPHVSYYSAHDNFLQYASSDGDAWTVGTADWNGGQYTSLVMGADDLPHVSHYDPVQQHLVYAYYNGAAWQREIVDESGDVGQYSSLAMQGSYLQISYYDVTDGDLMIATPGKGGWFTETVDGGPDDVGIGSSLDFDSKGHPHISYVDQTNLDLRYARFDGKKWLIETVEGKDVDVGGSTSLALAGDQPHIAYTARDTLIPPAYRLKYATYAGGSWSKETVESAGSTGLHPSIAMDGAGRPHITYYDVGTGRLRYAVGQPPCAEAVTGVSVQGPATVLSGTAAVFTATASPSSATLPVTFLWETAGQDGVEGVEGAIQSSQSFTWTVEGTKTVTVTATNCGGSAWATRTVTVAAPLPDLVVTDVWEDDYEVWYLAKNEGDGAAPGGWHSSLEIDGLSGKDDHVGAILGPGDTIDSFFSGGYACSPPQDVITVCVDSRDEVVESDETNNCRQETWICDTTPPEITVGPVVSATGTTTVTIHWQTDEKSNSVVRYGRKAGVVDDESEDPEPLKDHTITITDLEPATTYHYTVASTDDDDNSVESWTAYFETDPEPDDQAPTVTNLQVSRAGKERFEFTAEATDVSGVERVQFYLDDDLVGTSYTTTRHHRVPLAPSKLDLAREGFYAPHTVAAVAVDQQGLTQRVEIPFTPDHEDMDVSVVWRAPASEHTIHTAGQTAPGGTSLRLEVYAVQYAWQCLHVPDPRIGEFCAERAEDVSRVEFYVDGVLKHTSTSPTLRRIHRYDWPVGGLEADRQHIVTATVVASDGGRHEVLPARIVNIVQGRARVWVHRSVTRVGNSFQVTLTVGNGGLTNATLTGITDNLKGFQPISRTGDAEYAVSVAHDPQSLLSAVVVKLEPGKILFPDETIDLVYDAVPILHADLGDADYGMGAEPLSLAYTDLDGPQVREQAWETYVTTDGEHMAEAVGLAIRAANYLIVTNPDYVFAFNSADHDGVNTLLSTMAHLAQLKHGVLGYLTREHNNRPDTGRAQIREWGSIMMQEDGTPENYLYSGYLLLVGETEIVPSYVSVHKLEDLFGKETRTVHWTDMPYGNTAGKIEKPELAVGRIIGNNARQLTVPLATSIGVYLQEAGHEFDRSDALAVAGRGSGVTAFEANVDQVARVLDDEFSVVKLKKRQVEEGGENMDAVFKANADSKDVIFYRDHCGPNTWSGVASTGSFGGANPLDFGGTKPFAFACCCQAGRYEDTGEDGIAEHFLRHGAPAYIGATENSKREPNNHACKKFFQRWVGGTRSIGQELKEVKRGFQTAEGRYWSAEYNLYGDPTYGSGSTMGPLGTGRRGAQTPTLTVTVSVPEYEISTVDGKDHVEIAGGMPLYELGEPIVPFYPSELVYTAGYQVQDVTLVARSGLITDTGLHIPTFTAACDLEGFRRGDARANGAESLWWPEGDPFDWEVSEMPDGSSILTIVVYPFHYNQLTTDVAFYQTFEFEVDVISSSVSLSELATGSLAYPQGESVDVNFRLDNTGGPLDVIVEAVVSADGDEDVADGLLLQSLDGLAGIGHFSAQWDSSGFDPGQYTVDVALLNSDGQVLDRGTVPFRLGIASGEVTSFTAEPIVFECGEDVRASLIFSNTGTVPLSGTLEIQVQSSEGEVIEQLIDDFEDLAPGGACQFDGVLDTTGWPRDAYLVLGYARYDARTTDAQMVAVSNLEHVYLPVVMREE